MAYSKTWDESSPTVRKRIQRLTKIIRGLKWRDELWPKLKSDPLFKRINYTAIKIKLEREQKQKPMTELGKAWSGVPVKPHLAMRLFPDPKRRKRFAAYARQEVTIAQLEEKFPEISGINTRERSKIFEHLKIKRSLFGMAALRGRKPRKEPQSKAKEPIWSLSLPKEKREELLADWRQDPRLPNKTNFDLVEKWRALGCTSEDMLRRGVKALGEEKSRQQIMAEVKTPAQIEKMIEAKMMELIAGGALAENQGENDLYKRVRVLFLQQCQEATYEFTRDRFDEILERVVWTEGKGGTLTTLDEYIDSGLTPEDFHRDHRRVRLSFDAVKEKWQERKGLTNRLSRVRFEARLLRGVGRFASPEEFLSGEDFRFPRNSCHNPYPIFTEDSGSVVILNGANIGTEFIPIIQKNPRVNTLIMAREEGDSAVIITNAIDIYLKKAGGAASRVLAAIWSGMNVNPDLFPESYRAEVLKTLKDKRDDAVVYQNPRESLHNVMSGWHKLAVEPVGRKSQEVRPVFPGKVYVIFGVREHQTAATMAYWHVNRLTREKQAQIKVRLSALYAVLRELEKEARKEGTTVEVSPDLAEDIAKYQDLDARTIVSNVIEEYWQLYYYRAIGYLARKFEEVIPNCKVIGMSNTHLKLGQETMTIQIPSDTSINDSTLSNYTHSFGPKVLRQEMPRFVAICHPYGLGPRSTAREVDAEGKRDHAIVWTAPACLEEDYLRNHLKHIPTSDTPIARKLWNEVSTPGVLRVRLTNGILVPEDVPLEVINSYERRVR